ncbi:piggyBac transposable element-derived protein 4-like [Parambassis ranga]|uniref:PiggyBac transposable element-derived protein 4-like n=1 Tax=Parambassis ranga TaxID=210632 RepID=A0A6P7ISU6_9TELE|nr:piggyBac transposable element-derived protein 4-like [Parambassis ranga]
MMHSLNVHHTLELLYRDEDAEGGFAPISTSEAESEDDEVTDLSFVISDESEEENELPTESPTKSPVQSRHGERSRKRSRPSQAQPHHGLEPWRTGNDPDTAPQISRFMPRRTPGAQVNPHATYSPLDLFQLYFSPSTVLTLCKNTNMYAAKKKEMGKKYQWVDVEFEEFYKFLGLLIYTSLVSLPSIRDYWKRNRITSVPFPATVMPRNRFLFLLWNIHPSDPDEDKKNDEKKGTPLYDKLFRVKPLMDNILSACQAHYHPKKELSIDERMVATKAKTGMTQYMKNKPTRWGIKMFVLADSGNGYTVSFNIYAGKTYTQKVHGLPYDTVMQLIQPSYLGTGYHVYMDNFYTSPQLFLDLAKMKFGACGTYRDNVKGCPTGRENALTRKSERGTVRWIREDPLLFVKWMDSQEVSICSTIHPAVSGEVIKRKVKEKDGCWAVKDILCPTPIIAYNKNMGGVDLSDQLIQYYSTHRQTTRWYRTLFFHFVDIATTNAYILYCDICATNQVKPMTHKEFQIELASQLCGVDKTCVPTKRKAEHIPVPITVVTDPSLKATQGRRVCQHCNQDKKRNLTPWKCQSCDVALCLIVDRNCFADWHK